MHTNIKPQLVHLRNIVLGNIFLLASWSHSAVYRPIMKEVWYPTIVLIPSIVTTVAPIIILVIMGYSGRRLRRFVASYAFSRVITKKTDNDGKTRWLFKDIDLTDEEKVLSKVFTSFFVLFLVLFFGVVVLFYQFLLIEVSFTCEPNVGKSQDCFKAVLWDVEAFMKFSRDSIDCTSAAVKNETVDVVCYKIGFNVGLASGAGYGAFQLSMVLLNAATTALLMSKQAKTICKIRVAMVFLSVVLLTAFVVVNTTRSLYVHFNSDNLVIALQMSLSTAVGYCFVFGVPWKQLIALKKTSNRQGASGSQNVALEDI